MKASLRWLHDHLDLSGVSVPELADLLTFAGIEVEGVTAVPDQVVVARIESFERHPDADKLSVCRVDDGSPERRQIVCGAKNFQAGDHVPLALPGARLGSMEIRVGKLRGVESHGMLCSARELGLAEESDGLLILPRETAPGTPLTSLYAPVLDLEITPNRPDLLSHLGLARELAALTARKLKRPAVYAATLSPRNAKPSEIAWADAESCPFYSARVIRGVKVGPSPEWLQEKLRAVGLRPIHNVVDVTNFLLLEMGQPLHAFDLGKIHGAARIRRAMPGEAFSALDGRRYALGAEDCVIADSRSVLALGGVMGGEDSGVTESTTDILLEAAYFAPAAIRRTAHRLGLHTDSSYRFERGVDPAQILGASEEAVRLILELAGGTADSRPATVGRVPETAFTVPLDNRRCRRLLGHALPAPRIRRILSSLGLAASPDGWKIPSYRLDLRRPIDLVEEVARVHGLDDLPARLQAPSVPVSKADLEHDFRRALRVRLRDLGFHECQTIKLISEDQLGHDLASQHRGLGPLRVKNPMTEPHAVLRPGLVPSLLRIAAHNVRMGEADLKLFETGTVFAATPKGQAVELQQLGLLVTGAREPASWQEARPESMDFPALRGVLESLCPRATVELHPVKDARLLVAVEIRIGGTGVGLAGLVPPAVGRALDLAQPVLVAEISLRKLQAATETPARFTPLPRFPAVTRDVAIEAPADLPAQAVVDFFRQAGEPLLESYRLFDVFSDPTGQKLPADRKSLAWSLVYRDAGGTLESSRVDEIHRKLLERLRAALPVGFR
jgi:phenylalanyl-tRNA synthetase beta chain